jgi:signal transduction histidine kinase
MSVALGVSGWLLAVTGLGTAALIRIRLSRHAEAVARACHEVRGPLTAVRLGLEPAVSPPRLSDSRLRAIELELGRAGVALDDLSAARVPRRPSQLEPVELGRLVASSVDAWRPVALAQGVSIAFEAPQGPFWVLGERLRLAQAVGNLLANATEHGGGAIEVRVGASGGEVHVEVADDGPGLPASLEELARRRRRRRPGAERGHGLGITGRVAEAHRGRLTAAPGERGARLVLALPAAPERGQIAPV